MFITVLTGSTAAWAQSEKPKIDLKVKKAEKKVDVLVDGELFTSYIHPDNIKKPVLWPVMSPEGNMLTRSYPMVDREGDRTDHPHHVGVWLNYGDVNGFDFWNNSEAIPPDDRDGYGTIYHQSIEKTKSGRGKATLVTTSVWKSPKDRVMLNEKAQFDFKAMDDIRIIDRTVTLTAAIDVKFTDNKEGMFAIRVARELELPSDEPTELMDSRGNVTKVEKMDNTDVKGNYRSSEGIEGAEVWGTRAEWMKLSSEIDGEEVSLVIIDNPSNPGYPTYWHARGYGLFAANTLGQNVFSEGREEMNFSLKKGESVTFKYRLVVAGKDLGDDQIDMLAEAFTKL
jgi:hypothetical protein